MKAAAVTDPGQVRPANEDSVFADPDTGLLIVADGMGGHAAGEVASGMAAETIAAFLREKLPASGTLVLDAPRLLGEAVRRADAAVRERAAADPTLNGMGTTAVVAICRDDDLALAHVGDSRAYLLHEGGLRRITEDHSLVARMVSAGTITPAEARKHHLRNVITRSLGFEGNAEAEVQILEWVRGDSLLLCTDGLTGMVEDDEIESILASHGADVEAAARALIALANEHGGTDNVSAVVAAHE
jgi:serine/threonine protein phosphatase PrpC